ncbi:MAG: serine/threonine protein kinase [Deltaproteobacteria bacterium]|nr:serine/threonine protein kinase [Deltaproteobacteria bacterium]
MLERIGNCRIVEEVASGGMAVVYRAIQEPLGRTVAIKALKSSAASEEHVITRFEREAKSLATLQHENIIHVYDFHRERGALFIVMEYVQGIDLYDLLEKCGRLPYDVAAIIAMQVARALDYVHYRSIVHRDIKPANVMLSRQGGVKVMDFGIARDTSFGDLTEAGTGIGTPAYMSPEQVLGDKLDARSDIFSLGVVLYQMVTGKKPFVEDEKRSAMHKIRLEKHVGARKLNPDIPRELERVIDKCLEKQPRDRWRSAQHMVMALERFLARHVEMNHHARLVLFLRAQNVITQLEAEEYLNPSGLGGASNAAPTNMQARHTVRAGMVAHGVTFGVLALMLGLIHVAPLGATPHTSVTINQTVGRGFIRLHAYPWAKVSIDGKPQGETPIDKPIELADGKHTVKFEHPWYVPVERTIEVNGATPDTAPVVSVDFPKEKITTLAGKTVPPEIGDALAPPEPAPGGGK